jgi:uncharacterized repeat protein (TIGR01451 family)
MKRSTRWIGSASAFALALTPTLAAAAPVGTASGLDITNTVSVAYNVGGVAQTAVTASDVFKVDRKIDLVVTTQESAAVSVTPGQTNAVTRFLVTNTSNATIDFLLAATQQAGGAARFTGTDNFNPNNVRVFVETNGTAGWQAGDTQATSLAAVASGDSVTVYVVADVPLGQVNGDIATQILTATAASGVTATTGYAGTGGSALAQTPAGTANGKTTVETVFADAQAEAATGDGLRDGRHAARADYRVASAVLSVAKYSRVVSDPFSGAASPRAIPGAVVEYCIVISNAAGAATADSVVASDAIPASLTYLTNSVFLNGAFNGTDTCTDTGGTAGNDGTNVAGGTVSNNFGSVAAGATRTLRFRATIN